MSDEEIETAVPVTAEPVGDPIVRHCAFCGVQFRQMFLTNHFFKCGTCTKIGKVVVMEED